MDDPRLAVLGKWTPENVLTPGYGNEYMFFVGRDDVHSILKYLITSETMVAKGNMYGYADDDLNQALMDLFKNPNVRVQMSLDKSQAGGVHAKKLIALDESLDPTNFYNSFCILQSATHSISHTKGMVLVGQGIAFDGSTNWSADGEGIGISLVPGKQPAGFKAQNNSLHVTTNHVAISRFGARLDAEHMIGLAQRSTSTVSGK